MAFLYPVARLIALFYRDTDFRERLGLYTPEVRKRLSIGWNIWLHAASAGEVNAITPFCNAFREAKPQARIILTTTSRTGKKIAEERGVADLVLLAPLDMTPVLKRAFGIIRPVMLLVAETEFWPNFLMRAGRNGIPLLLINGRISDKSFSSYQRMRSLFWPGLNCFGACLVQTPRDKEKLSALGVSEVRIQVAGQMKYDLRAPNAMVVGKFKNDLGLSDKDVLFTLGSLREGEDDLLLPIVPQLLALSPEVKLLIAPRHMKNAEVFTQKLQKAGVSTVLRSRLKGTAPSERVIVLDTLGELSLAYALSRAAFVGGTLVPVGGHNVMEPALVAVPVCVGPNTRNVSEAAEALLASQGGLLVKDGAALVEVFKAFLDPNQAQGAGRKAFEAVSSMRGATETTVERVLTAWPITPA